MPDYDYRPGAEDRHQLKKLGERTVERQLIDNQEHHDSQSPVRFFMERREDETGISATGRVLEGVLWQNDQVTVQWRPPMSTITVYKDFDTFMKIHVTSHPSCNVVVFIDEIEKSRVHLAGAQGMVEFRGGLR